VTVALHIGDDYFNPTICVRDVPFDICEQLEIRTKFVLFCDPEIYVTATARLDRSLRRADPKMHDVLTCNEADYPKSTLAKNRNTWMDLVAQ
jgi:hypothetical protein